MWPFLSRFFTKVEDQLEADDALGAGDLADVPEQAQPVPPAGLVVRDVPHPTANVALVEDPAFFISPDGWIIPTPGSIVKVERIPTRRIQKLATPRGEPHGIEWHWTATPAGSVRNAAKRIQELPKVKIVNGKEEKERAASFHLGIPQAGALIQLASVEVGTWHSGGATAARFKPNSNWQYLIHPNGPVSANAIFVGVELENVGEVRLVKGKWRSWPFREGEGHVIREENIVSFGTKSHRFYERFTEHQVHLATEFVRAMAIAYPRSITRASCSWGHVMIDPSRKTDPGPYWLEVILPKILDEVFP